MLTVTARSQQQKLGVRSKHLDQLFDVLLGAAAPIMGDKQQHWPPTVRQPGQIRPEPERPGRVLSDMPMLQRFIVGM